MSSVVLGTKSGQGEAVCLSEVYMHPHQASWLQFSRSSLLVGTSYMRRNNICFPFCIRPCEDARSYTFTLKVHYVVFIFFKKFKLQMFIFIE